MSANISDRPKKFAGLAKKVRGLPHRLVWLGTRIATITLIVGLIIGAGTAIYFRGRTIRYYKAQLSSTQKELKSTKSDLANATDALTNNNVEPCYDPNGTGVSGGCPDLTVVSSKVQDDSALSSGQHLLVVGVKLHNPTKDTLQINVGSITLKDNQDFVYDAIGDANYGYDGQTSTYTSISTVHNLYDDTTVTIQAGDSVRGFMVYKISDISAPFHLTFVSIKSNTFQP